MEGNGHKKTRKACFIRLYGSLMVLNEPVFGARYGTRTCDTLHVMQVL